MLVIIGKSEDIFTPERDCYANPIISTSTENELFKYFKNILGFQSKKVQVYFLFVTIFHRLSADVLFLYVWWAEMLKHFVWAVQIVLEMPITIQTNLEPLCIFWKVARASQM